MDRKKFSDGRATVTVYMSVSKKDGFLRWCKTNRTDQAEAGRAGCELLVRMPPCLADEILMGNWTEVERKIALLMPAEPDLAIQQEVNLERNAEVRGQPPRVPRRKPKDGTGK